MDNWVPNPNAKPYVPKKFQKPRPFNSARTREISKRRCLMKILQAGLLVVLVVTIVINITFIMETSRKLQQNAESLQNKADPQDDTSSVVQKDVAEVLPVTQTPSILVEVVSSKEVMSVTIDGTSIVHKDGLDADRGIHVIVLHQAKGSVMAKRVFDTYLQHEDEALVSFLKTITPGRIVIFAIKDEGSFQLKEEAREVIRKQGSLDISDLGWRDMWAFIALKDKTSLIEGRKASPSLDKWGDKVTLSITIYLLPIRESECPWPDDEVNQRRRAFCSKLEGYSNVCNCQEPASLEFPRLPLKNGQILDVPVSVIASDRPHYLYRMLRTLLLTPGVQKNKVTVFIDGYFEEPLEVTKLLGLRGIQHTPLGVKNARIAQHYKASLTATFNLFPDAQYAILIEEDLDVSPDFFNYFQQTMHLLDEDPSLYCVSAWNDQGYKHSCKDPSLLYRVETMPGLGWMLKRSLFKEELEPQWPTPEKQWDWDMWMRHQIIRKSRECIIPDISRTYHFGSKGLNMNPYFQEVYFNKHAFMTTPNVKLKSVDRMTKDKYEKLVIDLIQGGVVLDHTKDPCGDNFIPETSNQVYVMFIHMTSDTDFTTWKMLAKCYHLWDLDVRGYHKSMWRQYHKDNHLVIIGAPASPYSNLKPPNVTPILLEEKKEEDKKGR